MIQNDIMSALKAMLVSLVFVMKLLDVCQME